VCWLVGVVERVENRKWMMRLRRHKTSGEKLSLERVELRKFQNKKLDHALLFFYMWTCHTLILWALTHSKKYSKIKLNIIIHYSNNTIKVRINIIKKI